MASGLANYHLSNNRLIESRRPHEELADIDLEIEPNAKQLHVSGLAGGAIFAFRLSQGKSESEGASERTALAVSLVKLYRFTDEDLEDIGDFLREELAEVLEANPRPEAE